jgi:tRNA (guanine37-N1)-methyltransferase
MARAVEKGIVSYRNINIRDFAVDKHRTCDDAPYGGGPGMVLKAEPLAAALDFAGAPHLRTLCPTPSGRPFTQDYAKSLSAEEEIVLVCGRYEGIDQRVIDLYVSDEISVGDYVLSSGEIAAMVIIDAVYRLLDGVISLDSLAEESFVEGLLEYPQYTRPEVFRGLKVPEVLLSGHHANISAWRREQGIMKTRKYRPELLAGRKGYEI